MLLADNHFMVYAFGDKRSDGHGRRIMLPCDHDLLCSLGGSVSFRATSMAHPLRDHLTHAKSACSSTRPEAISGVVPAPLLELDLRFGGSSFQRQGGTGNRSWDGAGNSWGQSDQSRLPIPQPFRLPSPQNPSIGNGRFLAAASSNARSTMIVPLSRVPFALYGSGDDLRNNSLALPSRLDMSRQVSTLVFMPLTTWRWYSSSVANRVCVCVCVLRV